MLLCRRRWELAQTSVICLSLRYLPSNDIIANALWRRTVSPPVASLALTYPFSSVLLVPLCKGEGGSSSRLCTSPGSTIPRGLSVDDFGLSVRMADIILDFPLLLSVSCCECAGQVFPHRTYPSWADLDGDRDWHTDHQLQYERCWSRQLIRLK